MKKLLLLALLSFTQISKPVSAGHVIGGLTMIGGASGTAYALYKNYDLNKKITAIRAQLRNTQVNSPERAKLIAELNALIVLKNKYTLVIAGATAASGIGLYIFKFYRPLLNSAQLNAMNQANTQHNQELQTWNALRPQRDAALTQTVLDRQARRTARQTARNGQHECNICVESANPNSYIQLQQCHHVHCPNCLESQITIALNDHTPIGLLCSHMTGNRRCNSPFTPADITAITENDQEVINALQGMVIDPNLRQCPTPNCTQRFMHSNNIQTIQCAQCNVSYCSECRHNHPAIVPCVLAEAFYNPNAAANIALINRSTKPCPGCQFNIEKNGGCNHVRCERCNYYFCWQCLGDGGNCQSYSCNRPLTRLYNMLFN
jgi:IBR domain.